jgi:hypothetical protein
MTRDPRSTPSVHSHHGRFTNFEERNLERVLFWLSVLASIFLALTLINYLWPFANPNQPAARLRVGLIYDVSAFSFAVVAYSLFRARWLKTCLTVVTTWAFANASYGVGVVVFEPLSVWTISICLGELLISGVLIYFAVLEARHLKSSRIIV